MGKLEQREQRCDHGDRGQEVSEHCGDGIQASVRVKPLFHTYH